MAKTPLPPGSSSRAHSYLSSLFPGLGLLVPWMERAIHLQAIWAVSLLQYSNKKNDIFNILWVLVFGFATLNILSLVARRFEPHRNRLSFGETMAIGVVLMSVVLLGYELATVFKIFPLKLHAQ
jgi:uncharacterized membrane protein YczE